MMIKAGAPVDSVIDQLLPLLDRGDVDRRRRQQPVDRHDPPREASWPSTGIHFVGSGVSGGEEGARFGPSLMPGGSREAWKAIKPIWNAIAAKVDRKTGKPLEGAAPGKPVRAACPARRYIGADGAGHYVKMVHNGIEYGDMQLICEAYFLLQQPAGAEARRAGRDLRRAGTRATSTRS